MPDRPMTMRVRVPVATDRGAPITGIVGAKWTANTRATEFAVADLASYDAVDAAGPDSRPRPVPTSWQRHAARFRAQWRLAGHTVTLDAGFEPGTTYQVFYRAANPPVAGLGFVAVRDTASWLKHQPDAAAPVRRAYGFGSSQSGRFCAASFTRGFNTDEKIGRCSTPSSRILPVRREST